MKNFFSHLYKYFSNDWAIIYINTKKPPVEGDSISVGNLTTTFTQSK